MKACLLDDFGLENLRLGETQTPTPNKHEIHPVIDKVYAFEQAREAYQHLGRGAFGKVVIKVNA